ncbi:hypothetical protein AU195_15950 [Mycobacterium sp. IS-1496]|uniref:hypothetical protein n=1 Tax=Mycobacterium sp. IS-1496 TaxID=1772284 RepID=UPI0007418060|nr:hypothetical protein [Mycobacterium sp. IS-1496]KUI38443.1 hypothetical protein AU195_15950 [Mycobacterium sp. IS-1496]
MDIGRAAVVVAATALSVTGCGYRLGAYPAEPAPASEPVETRAIAATAATPEVPEIRQNASVAAANHGVPPNADGDPACPSSLAWGRQPEGGGVLVTVTTDYATAVTVLVRTNSGVDIADRGILDRGDLRLFEFPTIDAAAVTEVLIMTNTQRCFAVADPVTFN